MQNFDIDNELAVCEALNDGLNAFVSGTVNPVANNYLMSSLRFYPEALRRLKRLREILEVGGLCPEAWKEIRDLLNIGKDA